MSNKLSDLGIADLLNLKLSNQQKWLGAIVAGLLFLILSSTFAYQLTNKLTTAIFGEKAATLGPNGPTVFGLILHAIVFVLLFRLILW
jgi:hypothetical protein